MKLVFPSNAVKSSSLPAICRGLLNYSTETTLASSSSTAPTSTSLGVKKKRDTLYSRISPVGDPQVSILPIIDQWIQEGKTCKKDELKTLIKKLRNFKRFKHALEISQWMSDQWIFVLSPADIAIRLDLISELHGIVEADKYFNNITKSSKDFQVYLALLKCYAHEKSIEKAETLMQKMRELEFARTPLAYNVLLNLYTKVGQYDKLDTLMEEMKEKGIHPDKYTYTIRLNAYAASSNIDGIEKILQMMEVDPKLIMDWNCYAIAGRGYINAGIIDKALERLKKSEELITGKKRKLAYDYLLTVYAGTGRKEELYRIWNQCKSSGKVYNTTYHHMMCSLLKLDDLAGAEKILEEWELGCTSYDFRIPNVLIAAYCKNGLVEKAELLVNKAIEKGKKPLKTTWEILAAGYIQGDQVPKAVDAIKAVFLERRAGWKPNRDTLAACLAYLKQEGDAEKTEEFVRLLGAPSYISIDNCDKLLEHIYKDKKEPESGNGSPESGEVNEIDDNGLDDETDEIVKEYT